MPKLHSKPTKGGFNDATSYLYIVYWDYKFFARLALVERIVPLALLFLSGVELASPLGHHFPWTRVFPRMVHAPSWLPEVVTALLFAVAAVLVYHHHRLQVRAARHRALLAATTTLLESESSSDNVPLRQIIRDVLSTLVVTLEHGRNQGRVMNASVMFRECETQAFKLIEQDSATVFSEQIALDSAESVAGKVARVATGALVYVPNTKYIHGVKIAAGQTITAKKTERFRQTEIEPRAYQRIEGYDDILRSLLCVRIPADEAAFGRRDPQTTISPGCCFVLSLSARKSDCMGELEFHAVKLAASLISMALRGKASADLG